MDAFILCFMLTVNSNLCLCACRHDHEKVAEITHYIQCLVSDKNVLMIPISKAPFLLL